VKILVTGGAGYVGSVSVERLLAAGHDVVVLDDLSTGHRTALLGVRLVEGSYADEPALVALLEGERIEAILHCAARSLVPESIVDPARYYRDNVAGGVALLEAVRTVGVRRFVFSSTAAVYGTPTTTPIREDAPVAPINPYGETKRTLEAGLRWYGSAYGLHSVALRYFNVAGASARNGECHDPETHLIPNVLAAAETGDPVTIFGTDYPTPDGTAIRDYIHVMDLADAHLAALEATQPTDRGTGDPDHPRDASRGRVLTLNLGSAVGFSVQEVIAAAEQVVGRPIPTKPGSRRPGDPPILVAANERAREVIGWTPRRGSLDVMIGSAWAWRRGHPAGYGEES
jgi:UDP-glucose-4-epimerase GalE